MFPPSIKSQASALVEEPSSRRTIACLLAASYRLVACSRMSPRLLELLCSGSIGDVRVLSYEDTRITGGGFHLPISASDFGAYNRMVRLNGPFGAGSQLVSLSAPGLSFWK